MELGMKIYIFEDDDFNTVVVIAEDHLKAMKQLDDLDDGITYTLIDWYYVERQVIHL